MNRTLWLLWVVSLNHLIWGVVLLFSGDPVNVTAIHHISTVLGGRWTCCVGLLAISIAAIAGLLFKKRMLSLCCLLPQQFLVIGSAIAASQSIWSGTFADGTFRGHMFLGADQGIHILMGLFHTVSIVEVHSRELLDIFGQKIKNRKQV